MGLRMIFLWIFLFLVVAVLAYIRLAPHDPARWHQAAPQAPLGETVGEGSYVWRADLGDLEVFARLRFGKSDLGVNTRRVKGWLAQL